MLHIDSTVEHDVHLELVELVHGLLVHPRVESR
jgi:hypothetical protein